MKRQFSNILITIKSHLKVQLLVNIIKEKLPVMKTFWVKLTNREKVLISILGVVGCVFLLLSLVGAAINFTNQMQHTYSVSQAEKLQAVAMNKTYKSISKLSGNEFSSVKLERIKEDMTQVLNSKDLEAIMQDNILTIKCDNITFESGMLFLDQMRKSYGLFPESLIITTTFNSGFILLKVIFKVEEQ